MFKNTKNLKVEIVKIRESLTNIPSGKCIVDCEINGIDQALTITLDVLEDIKTFDGYSKLLYMYSHRGHRNWNIDGFLPINSRTKLFFEAFNANQYTLELFNDLKKGSYKARVKDNSAVDEIIKQIEKHDFVFYDHILESFQKNYNVDIDILCGVIHQLSKKIALIQAQLD